MMAGEAAGAARDTQVAPASGVPFVLSGPTVSVVASGCAATLVNSTAPLGERVRAHLEGHADGAPVLVGALPFDRDRPAHLFQPRHWSRDAGRFVLARTFGAPALVRARAPASWRVVAEPTLYAYRMAVARALMLMTERPELRKLVLSRSLRLTCDGTIDPCGLLARLAEDACVTAFAVPLPSSGGVERLMVGATPELLVSKSGDAVVSAPLAGSARRSADPEVDRAAAESLVVSEKDRREHGEVVTAILDGLAPHCRELGTPEGTQLVSTASMWHLGTRIVGRLRDADQSSVELATLLHPTPAVCGTPREQATGLIADLEGCDRGFYAGAVGWCDADGEGAWYVALRCAEIAGNEARLYAGAGIVPGSDPVAEGEETAAKFAAMLRALGVDERIAFDEDVA